MKKLFSQKQDAQYDTFVGKSYTVCTFNLVVEHVIAEGGFSYVFLVRDTATNEHYALKRMLVNSRGDLENCTQEIEIMKQFHKHPCVATLKAHNSKHIGNGIYEVLMLMKNYKQGTVVDKMNDNLTTGFSEIEVLTIMHSVVDAVAAMHAGNVLHRDLKVENILIGERGNYVLCDFGSAIRGVMDPERDGHSKVEENINRFTTLAYRAPEMIDLYGGLKISSPADVWALGVLLYKLCFFTTPFEENTLAIARAKYTIPPTSRYSEHMHNIIRDILKPDPSARPTAADILLLLKVEPPTAAPTRGTSLKHAKEAESAAQQSLAASISVPSQNKVPAAAPIAIPQAEQVSTTVKSRQRPRGHFTKNTSSEKLIMAPPALAKSAPTVISPLSKLAVVLPVPAQAGTNTTQASIAIPRPTPPPSPRSPRSPLDPIAPPVSKKTAGQSSQDARQDKNHSTETRVQRHSVACCEGIPHHDKDGKDPWGQAPGTSQRQTPSSPRIISRHRPAPVQPAINIALLPPPPSSPSHHISNKLRRTHHRAKSDTTFLRNFNPSNPFVNDAESVNLLNPLVSNPPSNLSTSLGHLVQDQASCSSRASSAASFSSCEKISHRQLLSSSSSNVEPSIDNDGSPWSDPFDPEAAIEDEFTKLSLRDKPHSSSDSEGKPTVKVSRAHIESEEGRWSHAGDDKYRGHDNGQQQELLSSPTSPPISKKDRSRAKSGHSNEMPDSTKKKKKVRGLFGKKKQETEPDPISHFSIVSNPLHGHFDQS